MKTRFAVSMAALFALAAPMSQAAIPDGAISERIDRAANSAAYEYGNPKVNVPAFSWNVKYDRYFDGTRVVKHVEIDFSFEEALGFDDAQKTAWKAQAEQDIEGLWNGKYVVEDTANRLIFPVAVDVTLTGPFDQTVTVAKRGADCDTRPNDLDCRDNLSKWFSDSKPATRAHEFGHMIGLFDEYLGGAVDKFPDPTLSNDGIMGLGAVSDSPKFYDRYFQQYREFLGGLSFDQYSSLVGDRVGEVTAGTFILRPVPEPGTWAMLTAGLLIVGLTLRSRRPR
ncbi:MAG: PEP-CTERM sorting domain-containing protein [Burkholderiales bacterium]|nr:PEP-CTERM sorting domain-containing protein [Burkholderiales bacterium]